MLEEYLYILSMFMPVYGAPGYGSWIQAASFLLYTEQSAKIIFMPPKCEIIFNAVPKIIIHTISRKQYWSFSLFLPIQLSLVHTILRQQYRTFFYSSHMVIALPTIPIAMVVTLNLFVSYFVLVLFIGSLLLSCTALCQSFRHQYLSLFLALKNDNEL